MPHAPDLSGRALDGRYELHAVIGEGTFGRVYRGRDRRLARPVAVKVIKPWWAEDPDWVRNFELEAQLLARVNDPGIVQIFDVGHAEEGLYYVSELVEGESLADRLRRGALSPVDAREIAEQLCRALTQAHAQRVVHRDIKPANVLISADGRVKVGDFGIARLAEGSSDGGGATIVGTPRYMAPEQARGGSTGPATDVYSVGVVLYEILAGRPPFLERSAVELALRHLSDPPPPLPPRTPPILAAIVARALAKDPGERYPSAGAMADALARVKDADLGASGGSGGQPVRMNLAASATSPGTKPGDSRADDRTAATALLERGPEGVAATRVQPPKLPPTRDVVSPPRRDVDLNARKRRRIGAACAVLLAFGIAAGAILIAVGGHVKVPDLRGSAKAAIAARLRRLDLKPSFHARYSQAASGTAIDQTPRAGTRVSEGSTVRVVLSAGPPPIPVPQLVGRSGTEAQQILSGVGLHGTLTQVAAPGIDPGIVTHESPAAGAALRPGRTVTLSVAETPRWRPLTSFSGEASGHSVPFRILGDQWRVVYRMGYQGLCTLIFFCSGPSAQVIDPSSGARVSRFGLSSGTDETEVFKSGAGLYQIDVSPGGDTAKWSITVEDYY